MSQNKNKRQKRRASPCGFCDTQSTIIKRDRFYDKNNRKNASDEGKIFARFSPKQLQIKNKFSLSCVIRSAEKSIDDENKSLLGRAFKRKLLLSLSMYFPSHTCRRRIFLVKEFPRLANAVLCFCFPSFSFISLS
jgi:hypothetical protein